MTRFVGRENVRKRLATLDGTEGRTEYGNGAARVTTADGTIVVRPAFGLAHAAEYDRVELAPLLEALAAEHVVAAVVVSLGGYAVGVFEGERLVASKVGTRFVKGRHRKGGSSATRFRRRRDEQARALLDEAAEVTAAVLDPWRGRVDFVALGGDRAAVAQLLDRAPALAWLRERALPRFFSISRPRLESLRRLPYDLYAAELTEETE
jgi:Actinobacteria/chloroflexi VLRF1 release factor